MSTNRYSIQEVWVRIERHAGEKFETITGKPFTYEVLGDYLRTDRAEQDLGIREFEKALEEVPLDGPGEINDKVRGPSYIWAILHDRRVRGHDW
ncbi:MULTISPECIES: hypothetical protein [unclassified Halomonas]|uniref:hypothetical protein n=1 Tax=unclassified Halomonas TaxID=2609666 RepID=UPI00288508B6|nr:MULTISPECIES: hypothetical protein [unclassified Halomonas]MDT0501757.1 hypothetical protein [Halomonas sp. PAR7]MDT0513413.1 hypothetical protein [Halomonas sp. LES1]MDT0591820.1 hypothetical protein [Halomonas sp. PAR8]